MPGNRLHPSLQGRRGADQEQQPGGPQPSRIQRRAGGRRDHLQSRQLLAAVPAAGTAFADLNGHLIANRRFKPGEYLGGELAGRTEMPPQVPIHVSLDILDPGPKAVNYSLSFHSRSDRKDLAGRRRAATPTRSRGALRRKCRSSSNCKN
ncbi:DUF3426 domain-containing protein [Pseudomonas aeruginosa]|nr:DUF3426 domain-containing protein [Pseudomonas aeruginosa]